MYPLGLFQYNQRESSIWFNFPTNSQRTHWVYGWVHCGQINGYFLKELFVSGSGTWWALFERNSQRTHWVLSKSYLVGTLVGTFEKYPPLTHWVKVGQIVSEPSMYSAWTHWVIDPLPPVMLGIPGEDGHEFGRWYRHKGTRWGWGCSFSRSILQNTHGL